MGGSPRDGSPVGELPAPSQTYTLTLLQVTSVVLFSFRTRQQATGTNPEAFEAFARKVLLHNLLLGWWGFPVGIIWTPIALVRNRRALAQLRALVTQTAAPGSHPDGPAGTSSATGAGSAAPTA
jgi:hypothetical protein